MIAGYKKNEHESETGSVSFEESAFRSGLSCETTGTSGRTRPCRTDEVIVRISSVMAVFYTACFSKPAQASSMLWQ